MLRGNLSSRPFYNERLVSLALGVVAAGAIALTVFNGFTLYDLSSQRSTLKAQITADSAAAAEINRAAAALQRSVDRATLTSLAESTQEANSLIDSRTFSWTEFFGYIETTMPMDLRLIAVAPRIEKGEIRVTMSVVAKRSDDIETFVEALQRTGAFYDAYPKATDRNEEDGSLRSDVIAYYLPPKGTSAPSKPPAASKTVKAGKERP